MPDIPLSFGLLLVFFTLGTGMLAVRTAMQVVRLRNKRLSWRAGTLAGFPLFSTVFLTISIALVGMMWGESSFWRMVAACLYLSISLSWFVSSYLSSKHYVTDHGLVKNINDPSQTIAWHCIHDFFERKQAQKVTYTFLYKERNAGPLRRLELSVPNRSHKKFKKLISHKLGRRISCYEDTQFELSNFK